MLKGTSMEVQVVGAQLSYKFVTSPIHKRKARAVSLCTKLHVGMAQVKVYQTYKLRTAWGINLLLHLSQVWFFLFPASMNFMSLEYWIHEWMTGSTLFYSDKHISTALFLVIFMSPLVKMEVLGLFAEAWFAKQCWVIYICWCTYWWVVHLSLKV